MNLLWRQCGFGWLAAIGCAIGAGVLADEAPQPGSFPFRVVGYLPDYRLDGYVADPGAGLTDLIYFSISVEPTGAIDARQLRGPVLGALHKLQDQLKVRLHVCVGGWGRSQGFAPLARSPAARARFARELTQFCRENRFDGADIDWEHPATADEQCDYGTLLAQLRQSFRPLALQLTIAVAGWQVLTPAAIDAVDRIHLMAYDSPGRHSTLEFAKSEIERLVKQGAAHAKICLGIPFYGRQVAHADQSQTWAEIVENFHPGPGDDEQGGFSFNGIDTVTKKTRLARSARLAGVMVWELGQDARGQLSLLRAIGRAAARPTP